MPSARLCRPRHHRKRSLQLLVTAAIQRQEQQQHQQQDDDEGTTSDCQECQLVDVDGDLKLVCEGSTTAVSESARVVETVPANVLQDIEAKLEADLVTLLTTVTFAVSIIMCEFGVEKLLGHWLGLSPFGSVMCCVVGLFVILYIRFMGFRMIRLWF